MMSESPGSVISVPADLPGSCVVRWKIKRGQLVNPSMTVCQLVTSSREIHAIKPPGFGWANMIPKEGTSIQPGSELFRFVPCNHHVVMKDLCAECGANLRREGGSSGDRVTDASASIPMVHAIPELHVSESVAAEIALQDQQSLLAVRKLVLLVDLDQTIIHTTNDPQAFKYKDVHRYRLPGSPLVYHTRFRPHLLKVLDRLSNYYQMHICTFGNRVYAHQLASMIDPKRRYFSQRILSRDECFNPITKSSNLRALFPRGLNLVCIIDDRGEVWDWSPNLIHVKPYRFFPDIGDINAFAWTSAPPKPPASAALHFPTPTQLARKAQEASKTIPKSTSNPNSDSSSSNNISNITEEESKEQTEALSSVVETPDQVTPTKSSEPQPASCATDTDESNKSSPKSDQILDNGIKNEDVDFPKIDQPTDPADQIPATKTSSDSAHHQPNQSPDNKTDHTSTAANDTDLAASTTIADMLNSDGHATPLIISEQELDELDEDYLLHLQEILLRIHRDYFREYDRLLAEQSPDNRDSTSRKDANSESAPKVTTNNLESDTAKFSSKPITSITNPKHLPHVSRIIAQQRSQVLGPDLHVTLSGLAPSHVPADRCLAGRIVRSLGAVLHAGLRLPPVSVTNVSENSVIQDGSESATNHEIDIRPSKYPRRNPTHTTHLIACRRGTEKVNAATKYLMTLDPSARASPPIHLVSAHWLWACHYHWERLPESKFPLNQDSHPCEFDPDVEPAPGTMRYTRRLHRRGTNPSSSHRHHRHHHQSHHHDVHRHHRSSSERSHSKHEYRKHRREHLREIESKTDNNDTPSSTLSTDDPAAVPQKLDLDVVRSAIDSIRAETKLSRKRKRHHYRHHHHHHQNEDQNSVGQSKRHRVDDSPNVGSDVVVASVENKLEMHSDQQINDTSKDDSSSSPSLASESSNGSGLELPSETKSAPPSNNLVSDQPASVNTTCPDEPVALTKETEDEQTTFESSTDEPQTSESEFPVVIKDKDEPDFDEGLVEPGLITIGIQDPKDNEEVEREPTEAEDEATTDCQTESEDLAAQIRAYLPPPKSLVLADNPLIHLPPNATNLMLAEIEDAVLEEETAKASEIPREAELYDPAFLGLDDSSSSSSASSETWLRLPNQSLQTNLDDDDDDDDNAARRTSRKTSIGRSPKHADSDNLTNRLRSHTTTNPADVDRRRLHWQVQRELLIRRRHRATPEEAIRIDKKLRRFDALFRREERRRRSTDDLAFDLYRRRSGFSLGLFVDSDEERSDDELDPYDADYPKGWSPEERARDQALSSSPNTRCIYRPSRHHHHRLSRSMSPAIHSDPEPNLDFWRVADEVEDETKEWNTCPEGYDYEDAERTRKLMFSSRGDQIERAQLESKGRAHSTRCLFGADDEEDDRSSPDEDDGEPVVSDLSSVDDSDDVDEDEDLADECWNPLREFM